MIDPCAPLRLMPNVAWRAFLRSHPFWRAPLRLAGPCVRGAVVGLPLAAAVVPGAALYGPPASRYAPAWPGEAVGGSGWNSAYQPQRFAGGYGSGGGGFGPPSGFSGGGSAGYGGSPAGYGGGGSGPVPVATQFNPRGQMPGPAIWETLPVVPYAPPGALEPMRPRGEVPPVTQPPTTQPPVTVPPDLVIPPVDVPGVPPVTSVPEPTGWAVFLGAVLAAVIVRRRSC